MVIGNHPQEVIQVFSEWMFADKSEENIDWAVDIANQTSATTGALLNPTGAYIDYTADLASLEGAFPLLYVVQEGWGPVVQSWADDNTPSAQVLTILGSHIGFWEQPQEFNAALTDFLETVEIKN